MIKTKDAVDRYLEKAAAVGYITLTPELEVEIRSFYQWLEGQGYIKDELDRVVDASFIFGDDGIR